MKLTLITPTPPDICAFGVRGLSSYIKNKGHSVKTIFLPSSLEAPKHRYDNIYTYEENILDDVINLAKDSDLIGISFMTNYFDPALKITEKIRKELDVPIIWGGAHPTVKPDECLNYVDMVCIGEGEEALAELMHNMSEGNPYHNIKNLWVRKNGKILRNSLRPLIQNIDGLPFFDFDLKDQYVIDIRKNKVVEMDSELFKFILPREMHFNNTIRISFKTYASRGCPHRCSYCINNCLRKMYSGQRYLRKKSVDKVIEELEQIKDKFPFIEIFILFDDTFFARSTDEIAAFSEAYKKKIGLPFHIQVSPTTMSRKKMDCLIDAGLVFLEMGIQTGSERIKKLYQRTTSNERIIEAANLINSYQSKMLPPCYHVILDNPWENAEDVIDTLNTLIQLPKPFWLKLASLVFYPGTELYDIAKKSNFIEDELNDIYRKNMILPSDTYVNFLIYLAGHSYFPRIILKLLSQKKLVAVLNKDEYKKMFGLFKRLFEGAKLINKGFTAMLKGDFSKIFHYLKRQFEPVK
jgi:radical SAM superfamily enzyme YgiQ (UPF0313 family)